MKIIIINILGLILRVIDATTDQVINMGARS